MELLQLWYLCRQQYEAEILVLDLITKILVSISSSFYYNETLIQANIKTKFWNLLFLRISKLSSLLIFGQVETEIIEVKDIRVYFQFSHLQVVWSLKFLSNPENMQISKLTLLLIFDQIEAEILPKTNL